MITDKFLDIIKPILKNESGYVNDPDDTGGETYRGISRKYNPSWKGWSIIDEHKQLVGQLERFQILQNSLLENMVVEFYFIYWYCAMNLENINDSEIILNILDFGINAGSSIAVKTAQRIVKVPADGIIGEETTKAINNSVGFVERYKAKRIEYYIKLANKKPVYNKFLNGWVKRVKEL